MNTHPSPAGLPSLTTYSQVRRASGFVLTGFSDTGIQTDFCLAVGMGFGTRHGAAANFYGLFCKAILQ
jgi:hypothetical protein